jgi:hypothetical protein
MPPARQLRYAARSFSPPPLTPVPCPPAAPASSHGVIWGLQVLLRASLGPIGALALANPQCVSQRPASTSSPAAEEAASSWKTNALPAGATVFAVGTVAWYYHLFGRNVDAMTPAEEG